MEFLSGLYAGKLEGHSLNEMKAYASNFMKTSYTPDHLDILYEGIRHKVAHLARPYTVFDTHSKAKFRPQRRRLIAWTVLASRRNPPIEIVPEKRIRQIINTDTPWPVHYDHRIYVSIRSFASDIESSLKKYNRRLTTDAITRNHFAKFMEAYFPRL
jgi:hypothetical protein